jgi:hypothetical protein
MSVKIKIARYPTTRSTNLPEEVNGVIDAIGSTGLDHAEMAAIYCKSDFSDWHLMTKKRQFFKVILSPLDIDGMVPLMQATTDNEMLRSMGLSWVTCTTCRGTGITMIPGESDIFVGKCKKCAGIGFIDPDADLDDDAMITLKPRVKPGATPRPEPAVESAPVTPASTDGIEAVHGGTREKISAFLQDVKRSYLPIAGDLIGNKCSGKVVTKDILIEAIIDTFIDTIIDAEEKSA